MMSGPPGDSAKKIFLIAEVKKYPVLYSTNHPRYRDGAARDVAWDKIAEVLNIPRETCKHNWKILRDSLRQALKNKKNNPSTPWFYESYMAFVIPHLTRREKARKPRIKKTEETKLLMEIQEDQTDFPITEEQNDIEDTTWKQEEEVWKSEADADELFYAGVCAAARGLDADIQRELRRKCMMALFDAEAEHHGRRMVDPEDRDRL